MSDQQTDISVAMQLLSSVYKTLNELYITQGNGQEICRCEKMGKVYDK